MLKSAFDTDVADMMLCYSLPFDSVMNLGIANSSADMLEDLKLWEGI